MSSGFGVQAMRTTNAVRRWAAGLLLGFAALPASAGEYLVGTGVYDITGAAAEGSFFGYANPQQEVQGLHQRLRARAFVVQSPSSGTRVAYVSTDQGAMFQSVKLEVVRRLQARYGKVYSSDNVMLTATHTHVGNAGESHYTLYQLASADSSGAGYSTQNFEAVVNGIVKAIDRAHTNLASGSIELVEGELYGATRNRSLPAYAANPEAGLYADDTNKTMTMLKFRKDNGKEVGLLNWFAIHPTSFSNRFTLISADNKGYAQHFFEKSRGADYAAAETFVAAFANADEGDVVPTDGNANSAPGFEGSKNEYANAEAAGKKQLDRARQLYASRGVTLDGQLDFRHRWVAMEGFSVRPEFTGGATRQLCRAALGYSFAAGGENGPADIPGFYEGMTQGNVNLLQAFKASPLGGLILTAAGGLNLVSDDPCQHPKPNLIPTGTLNWVPNVLPYQVIVVGQLAIVGVPAEVTTMAGRRIRARVLQQLAPKGVRQVVVAGLANTYAGYLTTYAEFQTQNYEGASNQFGPNTLSAVEQIVSDMSGAMTAGKPVLSTVQPPDKRGEFRLERPGVLWDGKNFNEAFGRTLVDAAPAYDRGQQVTVRFLGGHPKNNLRTQDTFLRVERLQAGVWQTVMQDGGWDTEYRWTREGLDRSLIDIVWRISADTVPGQYRIRHFGDWKEQWTGRIQPYVGTSRSFTVR